MNMQEIPYNLLIDRDVTIITRGVHGAVLERVLADLIKQDN